jgi:ribosomal protein S11
MPITDYTSVRLDESTDAGEFLYQNISQHVSDRKTRNEALEFICRVDGPAPGRLACILTLSQMRLILNGLGQWGSSLASDAGLDAATQELAERGIESAEQFVRAAMKIREAAGKD